ncbi:restriction endonuclease subunit S [Porphyromonas gingivalis]|uniref:restriction endonuclease subunit S n=1 Tax=Porphyromonas gingivalis TaxID=837 RepID=UPI00097D5F37|nr:restriction endonuclease subunit S [Porphyromonas gingivalis]
MRFPQFNDQWKFATISEVCKTSTGSMNTQDKIEGGAYPFYVRSSTIERANKYTYDGIAILTPGDGAIGKVFHYSEGKIAVHQRVYILSDITIGTKYLFYYFADKFYNRVMRLSAKNTVDSVRINMITDMPISLPSLAEQEKIAGFLSLIDERIQSCSETIKERKREKAALRNQLFSQKLRFPKFSDEWQQTMLGEIAEIKKGSPLSKVDLIHSGYNLAIHYGELFTQYKEKITQVISRTNLLGFTSLEGDILMPSSDVTPRGLATASCIFLNGVILGGDMNIIRSITNQAVPMFLTYALIFQKDNIISKVSGTTVKHIYPKDLYSLEFYLPSLSEQEKIADFLSLIDECIEVEEELLEQYERQKRYLLKQMFI